MFPDITNQYRLQAFGQGGIGIGGLDDFQRFAFGCQPDPTATKLTDAASNELGLKILIAAEACVDRVGDGTCGLPATVRTDAVPEETVVVVLADVVKKAAARFGRFHDKLLQAVCLEVGALKQLIALNDISVMVLPMMEVQRVSRHMGCQCVFRKRQFG